MSDRVLRCLAVASVVAVTVVVTADLSVHAAAVGSGVLRDRAGEQLLALAYPLVGLVVVLHRPRNTIGWLLLGHGIAFSVLGLIDGLELLAGARGRSTRTFDTAHDVVWGPAMALLVALPILFPGGTPEGRFDRWVLRLIVVAAAGNAVGGLLRSERLVSVTFFAILSSGVLSIARFVIRARRARGVTRQQFRWVSWAFAALLASIGSMVVMAVVVPSTPEWAVDLIVGTAAMLIPISIGVGILRYRLWEIDRVITRTLVYGAVTIVLTSVYAALVVLPTLVLRIGESDLTVAAATLAVAALFRPVRDRTQAIIDRRFDRARYDAQRTVAAYATRLRETVDVGGLDAQLRDVVAATVRPSHVSLWWAGGGR